MRLSIYRHLLPGITIISLLGIASFSKHVQIGNIVFDFAVRVFLSFWFVRLYRALASKEKLGLNKLVVEDKGDIKIFLAYVYGIVFGVFSGFLTSWIISQYFNLDDVPRVLLSISNAVLIGFPILKTANDLEKSVENDDEYFEI